MADATRVLHEFACWCAENALKQAKVTDECYWNAIKTKRAWLDGKATDMELDAARAAWAAAWAAVRDAQNEELERRLMTLAPPAGDAQDERR